MKRLFDRRDRWNNEANAHARKIREALKPIVEQASEEGYSMRDLESVLIAEVETLILGAILSKEFGKRKTPSLNSDG